MGRPRASHAETESPRNIRSPGVRRLNRVEFNFQTTIGVWRPPRRMKNAPLLWISNVKEHPAVAVFQIHGCIFEAKDRWRYAWTYQPITLYVVLQATSGNLCVFSTR
jgi:hypothetical protein